jgi:hypothetical protein
MSILTDGTERAAWLARAHSLIMALQALETQISIAMLDRPTSSQAIALMQADQQLGIAAKSITEAATAIRGMR